MENNIGNVPYNATPEIEEQYRQFISDVLTRNKNFVNSFHSYVIEKQNYIKNQNRNKNKGDEMGM